MRLRFSIRDLLWLTLVVGMLMAWWLDQRVMNWQIDYDKQRIESLEFVRDLKYTVEQKNGTTIVTETTRNKQHILVDGQVMKLNLPETTK
jgi:hypothetical protein